MATVPYEDLLAGHPEPLDVPEAELADAVGSSRRVVVLDDDPTGTQSIRDLPVLTAWTKPDLEWALAQPTPGFFVLTNTRSLPPYDAARVNREIAQAVHAVAGATGIDCAFASRGDSTLRGHYPLETDVLTEEVEAEGMTVDGVLIVPALIEPGRVTVDSVHWMRTQEGMLEVGESEFARDRTFGYRNSDLRAWVEEKTDSRIPRGSVTAVTLEDLRARGPEAVSQILCGLSGARPVVIDAVTDADLRVLVSGLLRAEATGKRFLYRTGPSFLRARFGQRARPPASPEDLRACPPADGEQRHASGSGMVIVGSHVGLTTRQLESLSADGRSADVELDVHRVLDAGSRDAHVEDVSQLVIELLSRTETAADVVLHTSRSLVTGSDAQHSLQIARSVSSALVAVVRSVLTAVRPAFVLGKGGITSSDVATAGLVIRRAWSRGTVLPGTVSVWEPVSGPAEGIPYAVFAGNVGDENGLRDAVRRLQEAAC
ncbi:four-carbon acid sugar kinase family protein [Saccharopolyspora mangrovi]|uniref:Four-carbon acid sugar kinase family protein n=1 Tax=Saccharopolyspora mangrovi TaxID=3082379 RepID=A0ABU6AKE3_9PSEU|nr:four-carbon acid sugar kinase family protein [Saccharopolyspora sp. S2-29]MEB3371896.1 four-carbon acid sugar kinase family protein [Saccharopolyspora sp. S2-29]